MSRIQNILEKAEREGAVRRVRPFADAAGAPLTADASIAVAPVGGSSLAASPVAVIDDETPIAAAAAAPRSVRTVRSHLDRILLAALAPGAFTAEQYRALRTRVTHVDHDGAVDVILITSPGRGEGKSFTAANLALTMGQDFQSRICLVDADLRHSRQHSLFGVPATPGLADVLSGDAALHDALIAFEDQPLTVLPAGQLPAHPAELLGSTAMRRLLQTLRSQFDRVIIDAPSAAPLADIGILTPLVDSVVLVVQAGTTTKPAIQEAVSAIGQSKLLGVVLNGASAAA
jgi:capsular exopolysaccharide synthesis family protein